MQRSGCLNLLYRVVKNFAEIDLHPDVVSERVMSNVYEHLIRKFGASVNEKAGEFMTPSDVVRFVTKLVLHNDEAIFTQKGVIRTIYDTACGIGGFLSDAIKQIKEFNPHAKIVPFGQELDPETHAMAMISMLIQGFETDNIKQGSTLSNDQLQGKRFHYGLANPPFGFKWEKDQKAVNKERVELGFAGRFGAGLPRISDGSMLFLQTLVSKMEAPEHGGGRVGIVLSGSPLFNGSAGSGESEIRRWLFDSTAFGYRRITVERPYRFMFDGDQDLIDQLTGDKSFNQWDEDLRTAVLTSLNHLAETCRDRHHQILNRDDFRKALLDGCAQFVDVSKIKAPQLKLIEKSVRKPSEEADICYDKQGKPEPDSDLRDAENVPLLEDVNSRDAGRSCGMRFIGLNG